jgi:fermentation-respiration switch protein FrsA (DUF1100 family)
MRRSKVKSAAILVTVVVVILYLSAAILVYFKQGRFLYPSPENYRKSTPADSQISYEDLRIPVNSVDYVHAWWIPSAMSAGKVILFFHGNGYVMEDMVGTELDKLLPIGANLLIIDYRGYGSSTKLTPNESTINEDAEAALRYLLRGRSIRAADVFVLGRSVGTGAAVHLAGGSPGLGGLILESPFTSIDDAVAAAPWYLRIFPVSVILRSHFDNLSKIGSVRLPVLIVVGSADRLTPPEMAQKLLSAAHEPKSLYVIQNAGHNNLPIVGGETLASALRKFLNLER